MWSLSSHVSNLLSVVKARLQLITAHQLGSRALVSVWGHDTSDFWRCITRWAQPVTSGKAQANTLLRSLYFMTLPFTAAGYRRPGAVDAEWNEGPYTECLNPARSGFAKQTPGWAPWPDAPDTTTRSSIKASSLSRGALSLPGCQQTLMGLRARWIPFLCKRRARDAVVWPPFVPGRTMV